MTMGHVRVASWRPLQVSRGLFDVLPSGHIGRRPAIFTAEREALRLGALLETARAQSRASGVPVRWSATATGFVAVE